MLQIVLARHLASVTVFRVSFATALNPVSNYSIILPKSNTARFSVVVRSLEEGLGALKNLLISYSVTCSNNALVMLIKSVVN